MSKIKIICITIFSLILSVIFAFYSSGFFLLKLHKYSWKAIKASYYQTLGFEALINNYPLAIKAFLIPFLMSFLIVNLIIYSLGKKRESLHGDARFANFGEIRKAKLLEKKGGIIVGKSNGKILRYVGAQFVAVSAPTRSGKGVAIVVPNLLDWEESAVVLDIKQECFDITSKYRKEILKQEVFLFNPFSRETHCYNPFDYIDFNSDTTGIDLNSFADILYPPSGNDPFWSNQAKNLFMGVTYLLNDILESKIEDFEEEKRKFGMNLGSVLKLNSGFLGMSFNDFVETCFKLDEKEEFLKERTKDKLRAYLNVSKSENTSANIVASFTSPLMIFNEDVVAKATSSSDFDFRKLRKKKTTIYLGITPDRLNSASLLINLFFSQLIQENVKELPQKNADIKYTCLLLMDEFTSMGRSAIFEKAVSYMAGYKLRPLLIFQSISQLEAHPPIGYGREIAKNIMDNHACRVYYTPKADDANIISKMLGNKTVKNRSESRSHGGRSGGGGSKSQSDVARPLMLPQELQAMPSENEIIKIDAVNPIYCDKAFYYDDNHFVDKLRLVSPTLKALKKPKQEDFERAFFNGETKIKI